VTSIVDFDTFPWHIMSALVEKILSQIQNAYQVGGKDRMRKLVHRSWQPPRLTNSLEETMEQTNKESSSIVDDYLSARGRERCYEARDKYFLCLDRVERTTGKPILEDSVDCVQEYRQYTNNCLSSWVRYFNKQRKIAKSKPKDFVPKQSSN